MLKTPPVHPEILGPDYDPLEAFKRWQREAEQYEKSVGWWFTTDCVTKPYKDDD